jgi:hypothetical protein
LRGVPAYQNVELQELVLVDPRKNRDARVELSNYAPCAPDVYLLVIGQTKHYFRRSVESRLHILKALFGGEAARAEVNDFDIRFE